ncbi:MAG TPA: hypothetical protein VLW45_12675 [Pelomicrobium sp.]|nr:hypothetical protein [Pelomicrobium sp.]
MEARSADYEIVHVISEFRLLDEESYERVYWRDNGKSLALGYYVVTWTPGTIRRKFDERAEFRGPYRMEADARAAAARLFGAPGKHPPAREHDVPALVDLRDARGTASYPPAPRQILP